MTHEEFHELIHLVIDSPAHPPHALFDGGYDDWHARARLAHFLIMPEFNRIDTAIALFKSVVTAEVHDENSEDIEEKAFALQRLSLSLRNEKKDLEDALYHINLAIKLAEGSDFLYKYVLRGELWSDRWIILHQLGRTSAALAEADEKIEAYEEIPDLINSYLYFAYRFKAQIAAVQSTTLIMKDFMRKALSFIGEIPDSHKEKLEVAFSATHDNAAWILSEIDQATPHPDMVSWDI